MPDLWTRLRWAFGVAVVTALLLPFTLGRWSPLVAAGLFLAFWIVTSSIVNLCAASRKLAPRRPCRQARREFAGATTACSSLISASPCSSSA